MREPHLCTHSSKVRKGSHFYLLSRSEKAGEYLSEALARGATHLILPIGWQAVPHSVSTTFVDSVARQYREDACKRYRDVLDAVDLMGITGTKGKTTIAWLVSEALGVHCSYFGTLGIRHKDFDCQPGSNTTVELSRFLEELQWMREQGVSRAMVEVSSQGLDAHRVPVDAFRVRGFTDLSEEHLDHHGDMENYFLSKAAFFEESRHTLIHLDRSLWAQRLVGKLNANKVSYGFSEAADLRLQVEHESLMGLQLRLDYRGKTCRLKSSLIGFFNAENLGAALLFLLQSGLDFKEAVERLAAVKAIPGRLQRVGQNCFVDYAHSAQSLEFVLEVLRRLCPRKLHVVFGCGGERDRLKRPRMGRAAVQYADHVILTEDNSRNEDPAQIFADVCSGLDSQNQVEIMADRFQAIASSVQNMQTGDVLLVAGKGHETTQTRRGHVEHFSDVEVLEEVCRDKV